MKKSLILMLMALPFLFSSCSSDDGELKVDTEIWMIAKQGTTYSTTVPALFYIFEGSDYDPKTFDREHLMAFGATLKNSKGETVYSITTKTANKDDEGYKIHACKPGKYYIVCAPTGLVGISFRNLWKAKEVEVTKNKVSMFNANFKSLYASGYIEWDK